MKILFISSAIRPDYQCDLVLHGLRTLYGDSVIDVPRVSFLYSDFHDISTLYGRGFTLYGLLPDIPVDRSRIKQRIAAKEFDLIVYGSIQRSQDHFDLVTATYPPERVIFIDGEDQPHLLYNLVHVGLYFKRELITPHPGVYPIHFAIPAAKIGTQRSVPKDQVRASIDPRDRSTYIFTTEASYYREYARSLFAFTMRKGGFDCLRHYEILANRCLPIFLDIDECPDTMLQHLPRPVLRDILAVMDRDGTYWGTDEGKSQWTSLWRRIHLPFVCHSTTERLAQYILDTQRQEAAKVA